MKIALRASLFLISITLLGGESALDERLKITGDFRGRYENMDRDEPETDRHRYSIRFRVQTTWTLNKNWTIGARGVSGDPDNPHSTHQTLDDGFENMDFSLDRAFVRYTTKSVSAWFGKFAHPHRFLLPYGQVVWDHDVQPEGLAGSWSGDYFNAAAGYYVVDERSTESDLRMLTAQIGGQKSGKLKTAWQIAYYDHSDLEGAFLQNQEVGPIRLLDAQTTLDFPMGRITGQGGLQYIKNLDAVTSDGTGLSASLAIKTQGRLQRAFVQMMDLKEESAFHFTSQDEFLFANNYKGLLVSFQFKIWKNINLHPWIISTKSEVPDSSTIRRYRLDLNLSF